MIIFVDVDGVCADLGSEWIRRYNRDSGDNLTLEKITDWGIHKFVKPEYKLKIFDYLRDEDIYDYVEQIPGSLDGIRELRNAGHRVVFATTVARGARSSKFEWLIQNGYLSNSVDIIPPADNYIEVKDKSLLRGDLLIDDGYHNVSAFCGKSILYRTHHNKQYEWDLSAYNWNRVLELVC